MGDVGPTEITACVLLAAVTTALERADADLSGEVGVLNPQGIEPLSYLHQRPISSRAGRVLQRPNFGIMQRAISAHDVSPAHGGTEPRQVVFPGYLQ